MEGLLKVLVWRMEGSITEQEFSQIYQEWLKKKEILEQPVSTRNYFLNQVVPINKEITTESSYHKLFLSLCKDLAGESFQKLKNQFECGLDSLFTKMLGFLR